MHRMTRRTPTLTRRSLAPCKPITLLVPWPAGGDARFRNGDDHATRVRETCGRGKLVIERLSLVAKS